MTASGMVDNCVLLEFADEAEAYAEECQRFGAGASATRVISLEPRLRVVLQRHGVASVDSLAYFRPDSHARALEKSHDLLDWLQSRFQLEDELGVADTYKKIFLWYCRHYMFYMLWLSEIIAEVVHQHPNAAIQAQLSQGGGDGGGLLQAEERYLGLLAQGFCRQNEVPFETLGEERNAPRQSKRQTQIGWLRRLGYGVGASLHRAAIRRMGDQHPILVLTHGYHMDVLVKEAQDQFPDLKWVIRGERAGVQGKAAQVRLAFHAVTAGLGKNSKGLYMGEVWDQVVSLANGKTSEFDATLENTLDNLAQRVEEASDIFRHRGVGFAPQFAAKIRTGIAHTMRKLHRDVAATDEVLTLLRPSLVISPSARALAHTMGELKEKHQVPLFLVSHGSFTPKKTELEEKAWVPHGDGMIFASNAHCALQTPLAEGFVEQLNSSAQFVRTGPLAWGWPADRERSQRLKSKLLGPYKDCRVVVHAGTPKPRWGRHMHVFETPDEYVGALSELILAVDQSPGIFLVIRYRPLIMSSDELRELLPESDRFIISSDGPFLDTLGLTDLLVSFSSTTIEEALVNRVPVLLYGGGGRYQHIAAQEVSPGQPLEPGAVYTVRKAEHLADALPRILDINGPAPLPAELFEKYVYRDKDITPFPELVRSLAGNRYMETR